MDPCEQVFIDCIGNFLDDYVYLITGSDPSRVAKLFTKTAIDDNTVNVLISLSIIAACTRRKAVEDFVAQKATDATFMAAIAAIKADWTIRNDWNFSALHLLGQCILENGYYNNVKFIAKFRNRIGCNSYFSNDFHISKVPIKARRIILEKRSKVTRTKVLAAGNKVIAYCHVLTGKSAGTITRDSKGFATVTTTASTDEKSFSGARSCTVYTRKDIKYQDHMISV